jgi:hypothetical protein
MRVEFVVGTKISTELLESVFVLMADQLTKLVDD